MRIFFFALFWKNKWFSHLLGIYLFTGCCRFIYLKANISISRIKVQTWIQDIQLRIIYFVVTDIANWFISIRFPFLHANSLSLAFCNATFDQGVNERLVEWREDWIETEHNAPSVMYAEFVLFCEFPSRYCDISPCIYQVDPRKIFWVQNTIYSTQRALQSYNTRIYFLKHIAFIVRFSIVVCPSFVLFNL